MHASTIFESSSVRLARNGKYILFNKACRVIFIAVTFLSSFILLLFRICRNSRLWILFLSLIYEVILILLLNGLIYLDSLHSQRCVIGFCVVYLTMCATLVSIFYSTYLTRSFKKVHCNSTVTLSNYYSDYNF